MNQIEINSFICNSYLDLMSKFVSQGYLLGCAEDDYDHRYFYREQGYCKYVCGLARDYMAQILHENEKLSFFLENSWQYGIKMFQNNPSVKGFYVEKVCLVSIQKEGLMAGSENYKPLKTVFLGNDLVLDTTHLCVLYIPSIWNFSAIDGLIVKIEHEKETAHILPIQITVNNHHSRSDDKFFTDIWGSLKSQLNDYTIFIKFIWITLRNKEPELIQCCKRQSRSGEQEINPEYTRFWINVETINNDIMRYLR